MTMQDIRAISADDASSQCLVGIALDTVSKQDMLKALKTRRDAVRGEMDASVHAGGRRAMNVLYSGTSEKHALDHAITALEDQVRQKKGK